MSFAERLLQIKDIRGVVHKQNELKALDLDRRLRPILRFTYDPFIHFGYTIPESEVGYGIRELQKSDLDLLERGDRLEASDLTYWSYELYKGIIRKNLRIGIAAKGINKIFPELIRQHDVMLAKQLHWDKLQYPCWATAKLDGLRGIYRNGKMYTRNGKRIYGVDHILNELARFPYRNVDGELLIPGSDFNESSGKLRSFSVTPDAVYYIIDLPKDRSTFYNRLLRIKGMSAANGVLRMPATQRCTCATDIRQAYNKALKLGYEGLVIKPYNYQYEAKRSYSWMKMKPECTLDLRIINIEEGVGKFQGMLGAIVVQYNGKEVRVGTGFNNRLRQLIWTDPAQFIGATAEIGYMEQTHTGSLRFPVFKRMRRDK